MQQAAPLSTDVTQSTSPLLQERHVYKPFLYPWCYEAWMTQQRIHWLPEEVPLAEDVRNWKKDLTPAEKNLMTQIFRFFTQADVEVSNCYMKHYARVFGPVEVQMMLAAFANMETIHIAAYSHLLDTIGMPEVEYQAFMKYKAMKDKFDYMQSASMSSRHDIAKTMALFGAFTEGVQLFASFAILMNFPRMNKMKGMGQIVTWSVRDETLHCLSMIKLFNSFINENPDIWTQQLKDEIIEASQKVCLIEDSFIDLAFEMGGVQGLEPGEVKQYIRYISDRRLQQLNLEPVYGVSKNPLPWMDIMLNGAEHTNFFENRATEYAKASTQGSWEDVFADKAFGDKQAA
jgi:ribonucleoside-diphosphate reductase beta chain